MRIMDSKEQIYNTAGESEELAGRLKDLLAEAYPDPKGKIAASVMAQIRAERETEEKQLRAERAAARRRRQGLLMKWGGMAACMMILCGVLVIAAPLMNRADSMAADAPAEAQILADAADAVYDDAADTEAVTYTYTAEAEVTEEGAMTKCAPVKQASQAENSAENAACAQPEMMYAARTMSADAADEDCGETAEEKEAFLQSLFDEGLLTEEKYAAWMQTSGYHGVDDWTIGELCDFFSIEK